MKTEDDLTFEELDAIYCDWNRSGKDVEILGYECCRATLPFDPSDPVPVCLKPKGHDGPHVVDGCIEFTDDDKAKRTVEIAKNIDPGDWEGFLDFCGCTKDGYPKGKK